MVSVEFLSDLGLLYDVLEEITNLSLQLQEKKCSIPRADMLIRRTCKIITAMKEKPGEKVKECQKAAVELKFREITLKTNQSISVINRLQFLTSVSTNMQSRCFSMATSNVQSTVTDECIPDYTKLMKNIQVLDPEKWPAPDELDDVTYGQEEVESLCIRFKIETRKMIKNGFRDYLDNGGRRIPDTLMPLIHCIKSMPCSTAECERVFSAMNLIITDIQSSLDIKNSASVMFIKLNGPPLVKWDPNPYVTSWLLNHRSAGDEESQHGDHTAVSGNQAEKTSLWQLF